jgi:hypothetical protein
MVKDSTLQNTKSQRWKQLSDVMSMSVGDRVVSPLRPDPEDARWLLEEIRRQDALFKRPDVTKMPPGTSVFIDTLRVCAQGASNVPELLQFARLEDLLHVFTHARLLRRGIDSGRLKLTDAQWRHYSKDCCPSPHSGRPKANEKAAAVVWENHVGAVLAYRAVDQVHVGGQSDVDFVWDGAKVVLEAKAPNSTDPRALLQAINAACRQINRFAENGVVVLDLTRHSRVRMVDWDALRTDGSPISVAPSTDFVQDEIASRLKATWGSIDLEGLREAVKARECGKSVESIVAFTAATCWVNDENGDPVPRRLTSAHFQGVYEGSHPLGRMIQDALVRFG